MSQFIEYASFALTVLGGLFALYRMIDKQFVNLEQKQLSQFTDLKDTQQKNHHETDIRLTKIDTVVSPYGQDIMNLKKNQQENMIRLTELSSVVERVSKLERQVETLQTRR